jgi:cell division protein FtsB
MIAKFSKEKNRSKREIFPNFLLFLIILFFVSFLIISNFKIFQKRKEIIKKINNLKKEIEMLEEKNKSLKARISETGKKDYWEEKIRQEGYIREGESQIVVLPPKETEKKETENQGFPEKLFEKIRSFFQK